MAIFLGTCILHAEDEVDPNVLFKFKTILVEMPNDNVGGALQQVLERAIKEVFGVNPRFQVVQEKALADGDLKLAISKNLEGYLIETTLSLGATGEVFAAEQTKADSNLDDVGIRRSVVSLIKTTLQRIPFYGTVTGLENKQVTLDVGSFQGLEAGDLIHIGRVDHFKRHPLLKQIIDVQVVPVATVRLDQVEEGIAFGELIDEVPGEKLKRLHKVTGIEHPPKGVAASLNAKKPPLEDAYGFSSDSLPKYGLINMGIELGGFTSSTVVGTNNITGGGFYPAFHLQGEAWFTNSIFAEFGVRGGLVNYGYTGGSGGGTSTTSTSTTSLDFNVGYRYLFDRSILGPSLALKLGYHNFRWVASTNSTDYITARTYSGLNIGFEGQLPFGRRPFGAMMEINLLVFSGYSERDPVLDTTDGSSTVARFYAGGYWFFNPRISVRAGLDFQSYSRNFSSSVVTASTQQKTIGFLPSVQYYF